MRKLFIILLFLSCFNINSDAAYNYPWKTQPPFEVATIEGLKEVYHAGEPIIFSVEGKSQVDTGPQTGFYLSAAIYDIPRTKTIQGATGKYDANKRAWLVSLKAPTDSSKLYEIEILLYCGLDDSQCADIYGRAAKMEKRMPLKVQ